MADFAETVDAPDAGAITAPSDTEIECAEEFECADSVVGSCATTDAGCSADSISWETASQPTCDAVCKPPGDPCKFEKKVITCMKQLPFEECVDSTKMIEVEEEATRKVPKVIQEDVEVCKKVLVKREVPCKRTVMKDKEVPCKEWKLVDSTKTIQVPVEVDSTKMVYKYKTVKETKKVDKTIFVDETYTKKVQKCVPCKKIITTMKSVPCKKTIWVPKPCPAPEPVCPPAPVVKKKKCRHCKKCFH